MGLFQRLKSNPEAENEFNKALDIYGQLRKYPERSPQYRAQLKQVAEHTRNAIGLNNRHGDAHVMLANAYFLMFLDNFPERRDLHPLKLAAAVIQHWSDEPMRQYPWTKNADTGQILYSQVAEAVDTVIPEEPVSLPSQMRHLEVSYYEEATNKDPFA